MIIPRLFWQSLLLISLLGSPLTLLADAYDPSASVIRFQKKMAQRGNMESQFKLGLIYETGSGLDINLPAAISWYKKAADQNYTPASNRLIYLEVKRYGFRSDHHQWLKTLKKDAKFQDGEALFLLGLMYSEGTAVNKSLTTSLKLLRKAARGNIPGADTAIIRVEKELKQLQAEYANEQKIEKEEKKKTPLVIIAAKKAGTKTVRATPPSVAKKLPSTSTKKTTRVKFEYKKPTNKVKSVIKKQPPKIAKTMKKEVVTPIIIATPAADENEHPMDSICGGRNRFSRACR